MDMLALLLIVVLNLLEEFWLYVFLPSVSFVSDPCDVIFCSVLVCNILNFLGYDASFTTLNAFWLRITEQA